jgi:hypothetical protein
MKPILSLLGLALVMAGCVRVAPIRVEPIEITMNVNLRIVQELSEFFDDLDAQSDVLDPAAPETQEPSLPHAP